MQTLENRILDLRALSRSLDHPFSLSLDNLVSLGEKDQRKAESLLREADDKGRAKALVSLDDAKILAPLSCPPKIVCLGLNYRDQIAEQNAAIPEDLIIFMKPRTAITGPKWPHSQAAIRRQTGL